MDTLAGRIQDSELEVMKTLWRAGEPEPLIEIRRELAERRGWDDSTVKTLLRRLESKGAVRLVRRGVYEAVLTREEYSAWSTQAFINKIYSGSAKKLVASLVSEGKLSAEDIAELSAMFNGEDGHG
jgi:BlaI family penicillinase repressor